MISLKNTKVGRAQGVDDKPFLVGSIAVDQGKVGDN
jgi:hypothetical protein